LAIETDRTATFSLLAFNHYQFIVSNLIFSSLSNNKKLIILTMSTKMQVLLDKLIRVW